MTQATAQEQKVEQSVSLAALFTAFLIVSLCGIGGGGGIVWARRIAVEKRRWISDAEFADIVSLCQFMPGPNIVGIAVCVGANMRGAIGTIAALCGFLVIPWVVGLLVRRIMSRICSPDGSPEHPRWDCGSGCRASDSNWHKAAYAASPPPGSPAFCRACLQSHPLRQTAASRCPVRSGAAQHCRRRHPKCESTMTDPSAPIALSAHLALVSSISFGGFPTVLPDVRNFVVATHGWMTDQEFANFFAIAQSIPGPNMILMMSFLGWKVWGFPGAVASAFATFGPSCTIYLASYRLWDR